MKLGESSILAPFENIMNSSSPNLFPVKFKPQEDELFSSWVTRLALAHGLSGNRLADLMWADKRLGAKGRDFDRQLDKDLFEDLSEKTGLNVEQILNTSLISYTGYLISETPAFGPIPWILPWNVTTTQKRYGMQFCWQCLKEDANPYFRRKWRLSFVVTCTKHKIVLNDRCPKCSEPINYFWTPREEENLPIYVCKLCRFDLRDVKYETQSAEPLSSEIEYQLHFEDVLRKGWVENATGSNYSHLYFDGIYLIIRSLCGGEKRLSKVVADFYELDKLPSVIFNPNTVLEMRSILERRWLNILVGHLITNWHQDFVKLCEDNKIWSKELIHPSQNKSIPFWYCKVVNEYLSRPKYVCSELEINSMSKYVKSHRVKSNQELRKLFGYTAYTLLVQKKLIGYRAIKNRKCIYCNSVENQVKASSVGKRPINNYRYYCKICKRSYTPEPLVHRLAHSQETRNKAIKLKKDGLSCYKISKILSVSQNSVIKWYKNSI